MLRGSVRYACCSNNNPRLTGTVPLDRLTALPLYLSNNSLTGTIPRSMGSLQQLYLSNNGLTGTIPALDRLTALQPSTRR